MSLRTFFGLACLQLASCTLGTAWAQQKGPDDIWNPGPVLLARLPQYCWAQYRDDYRKQTGTKSPVDMCGVWMNHFCPGLVYLDHARNRNYPKARRAEYATKALGQVHYTIRGMPPGCALAGDVEAARVQAETLMRILK